MHRVLSFIALAVATVALTSLAAAAPDASTANPPVGRIARALGDNGTQIIVSVSVGDKQYAATTGKPRPRWSQRFRVGSVTKTFTATIVLQLVDEGKLRLEDRLEDHLPGIVPRGAEISVRQLLQHQSGLANYTDFPAWLAEADRSPSIQPIDVLRFAASSPLVFDPGSQWRYSNTNYVALGLIIETITGRTFAQELDARIFKPLALSRTQLPVTARLPDLRDGGVNPVLPWAAGAIVSNARDVARFYSTLLSGRLLSKASLAIMKSTVATGGPFRAGLGIFSTRERCGRTWGHTGGILEYLTLVSATEKGGRVSVISIKGRPSSFNEPDVGDLLCPARRLAVQARIR